MGHTGERVVAGRSAGFFELHDEVTREAVYFGLKQRLNTRITSFHAPAFFEDTMVQVLLRACGTSTISGKPGAIPL